MKKFLVFLVSIVVVVCLGLTTYYFMRNNEIITVKAKEIYCNAGDTIPLASLGIRIEKANVSKKTTFDYNAGGENVTKYIEFNQEAQAFIVSQENAGDVTLVIRTSNNKYADFTISVHIGNGTQENPYYIFNESQLMKIGSTYRLDSHYRLMNDITLTSEFKPLGYNTNTGSWGEFNGTFDGQGYSIKGLNLNNVESANVGFFSSLGSNSVVKNLTIQNATIAGTYQNAGVLAGVSNGTIEKVIVKNSTVTNSASNSSTGAVAGTIAGNAKLTYAENITLNVSGTEESNVENAIVGGLFGGINQSTIQACYTNNVTISVANATATAGGFAGTFQIGTETGSIQQSYSNTTSNYANFGSFIGSISHTDDFNLEKANMLRHLIGNFAVVYGKESQASIVDSDLVKVYNTEFFKNQNYFDRSVFFENSDSALYLIRGFISANEVISTNEFVYYAIDMNTITTWDTTYVWNTTNNSLPTLRMGNIYPASPSGEYFRRNLAQKTLGNSATFVDTFSSNVENQNIKLLDNVDLSAGWTPVSVKNTTIDGNNQTITINLNTTVDNRLGLFTTIDNCSIKNLNIVVTGVSANATNAGALAGTIISSDSLTTSSIENVTITYQNFATPVITNFGGLAGTIENTNVTSVNVVGLSVNSASSVSNAGAVAGTINANAKISNSSINATIYATENAGGVAGINNGTITSVTGTVAINSISTLANSFTGGVVATNNGTIDNVTLTANITIKTAGTTSNVGGVAGVNKGSISNVEINGENIAVETSTSTIYVGGVVATNDGTIENIENNIANIGTYHVGANHYVGGVVAVNNGTITKVLTQSNLNGNYVSGVVAQMNNSSAKIDQVVVGKYDAEARKLGKNTITGDKYLAGVVVDFKSGTITNVQASSEIVGQTNSTRSSLVALIFPYGANLKNATIDSSFSGYGITYREVWTDFASYANKAEFDLPASETYDGRFNLYMQDVHHGIMQSVVINSANAGVSGAKASMGGAFAWEKDYQDTADSSFIKVVDGFTSADQFQGSFKFQVGESSWAGINHTATKTLTFEIGSVWESNNGISLMFIDDLVA